MKRDRRSHAQLKIARHGRRDVRPCGSPRGFTLVELLVSAGLVVLMLLMFATIFQIATASLGTQRGIAENDQRARTLTTVIGNDIESRTFRRVIPFSSVPPQLAEYTTRSGYLYISENDPDDDREDVLALTVGPSGTPAYGRAARWFNDANGNGQFDSGETVYQNQPELDGDGDFQNQMASSPFAEVCYFVRGGNLYRRVMLIRPVAGLATQPSTDDGWEIFDPSNDGTNGLPPLYDGIFWRDFDYSAYYVDSNARLQFHGQDSLSNDPSGATFFSFGKPFTRFGHHHSTSGAANGQPREFINDSNGQPTVFIGRFTHEETSFSNEDRNGNGRLDAGEDQNNNDRLDGFSYPFDDPQAGNPYTRSDLTDSNGDATVDQYAGGPRRSEDIMMTHVHGFDVKVWDDALGRFVDVGHNVRGGDFYQTSEGVDASADTDNRNQHLAAGIRYGPRPPLSGPQTTEPRNRVFDTWHPDVDIDGDGTPDPPPFQPARDPVGDNDPTDFVLLPLRALQLTVRYYDVSSDQNRQLTLEFSLLE